jgi:hypothetical protein
MKNPVAAYFKRVHESYIGEWFNNLEEPKVYFFIYACTFLGLLYWLEFFGIHGGTLDFLYENLYDFLEYTLGLFGKILWFIACLLNVSGVIFSMGFVYCLIKSLFKK